MPARSDNEFSDSYNGATSVADTDLNDASSPSSISGDQTEDEPVIIAKAETSALRWLKLTVLGVLVLSALGVALAIYFYTSRTEQAQFHVVFTEHSSKVLEGVGKSLERTLAALDTFQTTLVSSAHASNQTWPFVTTPDYAVRATKTRLQSDAIILSAVPIVTRKQRREWEDYSIEHKGWVNQSMRVQATDEFYYGPIYYNHTFDGEIHSDYGPMSSNTSLMLPSWQASPVASLNYPPFNWDFLSAIHTEALEKCLETHRVILSRTNNLPDPTDPSELEEYESWVEWFRGFVPPEEDPGEPVNDIFYPILDSDLETVRIGDTVEDPNAPKMVGLLTATFYWRDLIKDLLPAGSNGIDIVFSNPCNPSFTYQINGPNATFLGRGNLHETAFDGYGVESDLAELGSYFIRRSKYTGIPLDPDYCPFTIAVFPSASMHARYVTTNPLYFTLGAVLIFAFTSAVFLLYDCMVERRQKKVMSNAARSNAIVSSLFPSVVRDRIYQKQDNKMERKAAFRLANSKTRLKSFLNDGTSLDVMNGSATRQNSAPIAELFPDTTVLFADIAGFTAWSSARDPSQVFLLLETLYGAFDVIARKRGVFKVETIGDSYVAVCGLPEPRHDHAVVMVRYACDCRDKMSELAHKLGKTLGPDTGELTLRFGLNSGPVTAGVLRGERSRFQLFGDTVNCAARMESNGKPNMIQLSQKTAELLIEAGKSHWLSARDDLIEVKGKGTMQTYWANPPRRAGSVGSRFEMAAEELTAEAEHESGRRRQSLNKAMPDKMESLIDWNVDTFSELLKKIVTKRVAMGGGKPHQPPSPDALGCCETIDPRAEVSEVVKLPEFQFHIKAGPKDFAEAKLDSAVLRQLRDYVSSIAFMYQENPFHNFEHASHVVMSTMKLLQRVVSPDVKITHDESEGAIHELASTLHSSTFGITSDPLTQFAIVFAALVHDVDHPGVSNAQLVAEQDPRAAVYKNQSVAEQNSVTIAWDLLMEPSYCDLRACLFASKNDLMRFRQLVVNSVMATDIFDKELKAMREDRWDRAFHPNESAMDDEDEDFNRKATIIIEHLIQASDVAHTMQHWTIYQKWNKRLFQEMILAYKNGRAPSNPANGWYKGELWFFDNYIIPLAKKLKDCRVFGVSCDEFLDYALDNRSEWEAKGEAIVAELVKDFEENFSDQPSDADLELESVGVPSGVGQQPATYGDRCFL